MKKVHLAALSLLVTLVMIGSAMFFASPQETAFPSLDELKGTNVSLEMTVFEFTSGLRPDQQGAPNGNGIEIYPVKAEGSGFIAKDDGTIITNYHVVRRAVSGRAVFEDGSSYEIAQIKVYDDVNDLAVLKLKAERSFPSVRMGDSDIINVMDKVLAIGNTLGENMAVTDGMINQIKKNDQNVRYQIRHSAVIAPGNSGGSLYRGSEVIGVNVSMRLPYSIYYAIPINIAKNLLSPQYDKTFSFRDVFPPDPEIILKKAIQVLSQTGQVDAATEKEPGMASLPTQFYPLEDLIVLLQAPENRDLALVISNSQGDIIGYGDTRGVPYDVVFMSNDYLQDVGITVLNSDKTPSNFAIKVFKIAW